MVIVISLIILLKHITTTKYSHSEIIALINKGIQGMDNMNNVSFDKETEDGTTTYYFKKNKKKMVSPDNNFVVITLEDGKTYLINKKEKKVFANNSKTLIGNGLQYDALHIEDLNKDVRYKDKLRYEFAYIGDDKIENKDCIVVKECVFYLETKEYVDASYNSKNETPVYWIEKSTGFVIGAALMESGKNTAIPQTIIKNIEFGKVTDDIFNEMFELSNDYNMFEYTADGKIVKVK